MKYFCALSLSMGNDRHVEAADKDEAQENMCSRCNARGCPGPKLAEAEKPTPGQLSLF